MRVASNKVQHIVDFYHSELDGIFEPGELDAMIATAFEHYLGFRRQELPRKLNENVNQSDLLNLYDCCKLLKQGKPLQYILHEAWFYDLKFYVDERVLIPRPETEELVNLILKEQNQSASFLDIGTGSGCIPVAIKKNIPAAEVYACDISSGALQVAERNAKQNDADIHFFNADVLNVSGFVKTAKRKFGVIISNPPYITASEKQSLQPQVIAHEPHVALFVEDEDAILFYRKIIGVSGELLHPGGALYFELNPQTAEEVKSCALETKFFHEVQLFKDMSGKIRFFKGIRK